jgi:serine/threonine-protein kinase
MTNKPEQSDAEQNDATTEQPGETMMQPPADETVNRPPVDPNATVVPTSSQQDTALFAGKDPHRTVIGNVNAVDPNETVVGSVQPTDDNATIIAQVDPNQTVIGGETSGSETVDFVPDAAGTETHIPGAGQSEDGFSLNDPSHAGTMIHGTQLQEIASRGAGDSGAIGGMIGDYRVQAELGRGGMGVVYKATHSKLKREVAIKMILHGKHTGPDAIARFLTEARAVANLQHPNIVQIFDIGEHEALPYFSLEFVPGTDLQKKIAKQPQPADEAAAMVEKLARAMQYAHGENILHRDLKPANVLISDAGVPKVTDFGLAKELDKSDSEGTQAGTIMGSPSYMSPEQAGGRTHEIGPPTDQYSLGAILYEMLTGRPPFLAAKPLDTVMQVVNNEPVAPRELQPDVPVDLETICLKTLQKDQAQRYENCEELANDLKRFLAGEPISARPVGAPERFWRWCKRNPKIAIPSAAAIAMLIAATGISTYSYTKVSAQNEIIAAKNADIRAKKEIADQKTEEALAAQAVAEEKKAEALSEKQRAEKNFLLAEARSGTLIKSVQTIMTDIGNQLVEPTTEPIRGDLLKLLSGLVDDLDEGIRENPETQITPSIMALRAQIAGHWKEMGKLEESEEMLRAQLDTAIGRMEYKKRSNAARYNVASIYHRLAGVIRDRGGSAELQLAELKLSRDLFTEILEHPKEILKGDPPMLLIESLYCETLMLEAVVYLDSGNYEETGHRFREAYNRRKSIVARIEDDPELTRAGPGMKAAIRAHLKAGLDKSRMGLAAHLVRVGEKEKGYEYYDEALESARSAYDKRKNGKTTGDYAAVLRNMGEARFRAKDIADAVVLQRKALPLYRELTEANTENLKNRERYSDMLFELASTLASTKDGTAEAKTLFAEALLVRREILAAESTAPRQSDLMLSLSRAGEAAGCFELYDALAEELSSVRHFDRARAVAILLADGVDHERATAKTAVEALQKAVELGYADRYRLKVEPDLAALRESADFKALVSQLNN